MPTVSGRIPRSISAPSRARRLSAACSGRLTTWLRSNSRDEPTARTDVWGLGVILYELLTLHRAFQSAKEIESSDPRRPRDLAHGLPLDLEAICWKAIRKEPARRYPSARRWPPTFGTGSRASR